MRLLCIGLGLVVVILLSLLPASHVVSAPRVPASQLLLNSSFELDSNGDGIPDYWTPVNLTSVDRLVRDAIDGSWSFAIAGVAGATKGLSQVVSVSGDAKDVILVGGFSKADRITPKGSVYEIELEALGAGGTSRVLPVSFTRETHDWQGHFKYQNAPNAFTRLRVTIVLASPTGTAKFDALHLSAPVSPNAR